MNYTPYHAVWEITYACNMRCKHCGSSCGEKYPNELSTDEALALCDALAGLGLRVLTLSGGEPFVRKDWHLIARRLTDRGVKTNVISNGWFVNEELVKKAFDSGIVNIAVSLDGLAETHDYMRTGGSFERVLASLDTMAELGMSSVVCTNVNRRNFGDLPGIKKIITDKKVPQWQIQLTRPMGNFKDSRDLVIRKDDLLSLVDFAYETARERKILVNLGDDIGYFGIKDTEIRNTCASLENPLRCWEGCQAGKQVIGIRANGDISGCLSIRDESFTEGNVRETPLREIWNRSGGFAWNRQASKTKLSGFCGKCQYARHCLGGCAGSRLYLTGSLSENDFCLYRIIIEKEAEKIGKIDSAEECFRNATACVEKKSYQLADEYFSRALSLDPENRYAVDMLGFVNFFLENYEVSKAWNEKALAWNPSNSYAMKGLGLCLARTGDVQGGIAHIVRAIGLAKSDSADYYYDLAVVLDEHGMTKEAIRVLDEVRKQSEKFKKSSEAFYDALVAKCARA